MHHGLSRITVAELRENYASIGFPTDKTSPLFLNDVNEILESLFNHGAWKGLRGVFGPFTVSSSGRITLPYYLDSIRAVRLGTSATQTFPQAIMSQDIEFIRHGPGDMEDQNLKLVVPDGEHPISAEFPASTSDTLSLTSTQTDTDKSVRIYGLDENGDEVRDSLGTPGELVAIGGTSTNSFSSVTGVVKPVTRGRVTLTLDTATPVTLATYEPSVKYPAFRRYKVDPVSSSSNGQITHVIAYCNRRFIPVSKEEDWVAPGSLKGWKFALMAQALENEVDKQRGAYWASALAEFNQEIMKYEEGENQAPAVEIWGFDVQGIRPVH